MFQEIKDKKNSICVVGMGYVGLPIALEFAKHYKVIGFDINSSRVQMLQNNEDPSKEVESSEFEGKDIIFTDKLEEIKSASF